MLPCLQHLLYSYLFLDTLLDYESVLLVVIYGIFTSHDLESYKHILLPWVCTMKPQGCLSNMPLVLALLKWSLEFCHSWDVHADCPRLPKTWFRILLLSLWRLDPLWTFHALNWCQQKCKWTIWERYFYFCTTDDLCLTFYITFGLMPLPGPEHVPRVIPPRLPRVREALGDPTNGLAEGILVLLSRDVGSRGGKQQKFGLRWGW